MGFPSNYSNDIIDKKSYNLSDIDSEFKNDKNKLLFILRFE